tara:strand:+ start:86 stop:355 length:270 start_codon:yes stop_codon:yes gene_type:complete
MVRVQRIIKCSGYVNSKRQEIVKKNIVRGTIPILSDIIVTDIHDKGHIPYTEFLIGHIEFYALSGILLTLVDCLYEYKKCSEDVCEISE